MLIRSLRFAALLSAGLLLPLSQAAVAQTANAVRAPGQTEAACTPRGGGNPSPERIAARRAMRQACRADEARFCGNVPAGCGERHRCMVSHASELSPNCASAIQRLHATR